MDRETRSLYTDVQGGVVRLQLPPPKWLSEVAAKDNPVDKWGSQLGEQVKAKLERDRQSAQAGQYNFVGTRITPTTQPQGSEPGTNGAGAATPGAPWRVTQFAGSNTLVLESTGSDNPATIQINTGGTVENGQVMVGGAPTLSLQGASTFVPNNVGLVFDVQGHVLVPLYLEKETIGGGVRASIGEGPVVTASFIAADKQTNLTVLQLTGKSFKPVRLGEKQPADGSLIMLLAPNSGSAKLMVWTGGQRDVAGVAVAVDGSVSGFARYGQFLSAGSCKPVVEQLVQFGRVKRAVLGVSVREVPRSDPAREQWDELGIQPALRVEDVRPGSAAARGDLQKGDLILTVANEQVGDPSSFAAAIANRTGKTALRVLRAGNALDLSVDLLPE
jgi:S1-C subfamily serine protease